MKQTLRNILNRKAAKINVLVVYENLRQGIQAIGLCDRLAEQLTPACQLRMGFWSVAALEVSALAGVARREADETDVVIVAIESKHALPPRMQRWLRQWADRRGDHRGVLAARIHGLMKLGFSPAFAGVKQIAEEAGVDFLWEALEGEGEWPVLAEVRDL